MIAANWRELQYYFMDLPLWASGFRTSARWSRMRRHLISDADSFAAGVRSLYRNQGLPLDEDELEQIVERAIQVKIARESEAFSCLGFGKLSPRYEIKGLEHLRMAMSQQRPIMLLTGHVGNFYTVSVALAQAEITAHSLARSVSSTNTLPRRYFERINYFLTELRMKGSWIYANYAGKLDRRLVTVCREGGILVVLPDLPRTLFPSGRRPVTFLGKASSLPARTIDLGLKYNAIFLTVWNTIQIEKGFRFRRCLRIEPAFLENVGADGILQEFSNRLTALVTTEPWQWLGTMLVDQFDESGRVGPVGAKLRNEDI